MKSKLETYSGEIVTPKGVAEMKFDCKGKSMKSLFFAYWEGKAKWFLVNFLWRKRFSRNLNEAIPASEITSFRFTWNMFLERKLTSCVVFKLEQSGSCEAKSDLTSKNFLSEYKNVFKQKRIQNPVKHLRWSVLRK